MGHYVYKYVLDDEIIYIGKNDTVLAERLKSHGKKGDNIPENGWEDINNAQIYYVELANSTMSDVFESEMIRRYKPKYNKAKMSKWDGLSFIEPEWKPFVYQKEGVQYDGSLPKYMQEPYNSSKLRMIKNRIANLWDKYELLSLIKNRHYIIQENEIVIPLHEYFNAANSPYWNNYLIYDNKRYALFWSFSRSFNKNRQDYDEYLYAHRIDIDKIAPFINDILNEYIRKMIYYVDFMEEHYPYYKNQNDEPFITKYIAYKEMSEKAI